MSKTLREIFIIALEATGEYMVKETNKTITYSNKARGEGWFFFLGKAGSLRVGQNKVTSIPCSDKFKDYLKKMVQVQS